MRRRRQRLQVSTFPFLAVLLCAMGSLILLLLVLDRRARVAARARAERAAQAAPAEDEKLAADRQPEWERRRQALHDLFAQQVQQARSKAESVNQKLQTSAQKFTAAQAGQRELAAQVGAERGRLSSVESQLAARRTSVAEEGLRTATARAEVDRLAREQQDLEQTLANLKALRQRQQQTYSVVPYRGKHGDNRRPLYVECTAAGLIFHPDGARLEVGQLGLPSIRELLERQFLQGTAASGSAAVESNKKPYLLLLVRPDGILTYTRLLAVVRQLDLDYGYELIEQDWVLDFPMDNQSTSSPSWMIAGPAPDRPEGGPGNPPRNLPAPSSRLIGGPARTVGPVAESNTGSGFSQVGEATAGTGVGMSPIPGLPVSRGFVPGSPAGALNLLGRPESASRGMVANSSPGEQAPAFPGRPGSAVSPGLGARGAAASIASPGATAPALSKPAALEKAAGPATPGTDSPGSVGPPAVARAPGQGADEREEIGVAGRPTPDHRRGTTSLLRNLPVASSGQPAGNPEQSEESPPSGTEPSNSVQRLLAGPPSAEKPEKPIRRTTDPPRRWISSRDWIIGIECVKDAVVVHPGGRRLATEEFGSNVGSNNSLQRTVQQLIERRQATVRPGEPPYRPQVRFLVRPDGLHSYYLAYPILEPLRVPMTRQNLEEEETRDQDSGVRNQHR